jgi:hypothetical protein
MQDAADTGYGSAALVGGGQRAAGRRQQRAARLAARSLGRLTAAS